MCSLACPTRYDIAAPMQSTPNGTLIIPIVSLSLFLSVVFITHSLGCGARFMRIANIPIDDVLGVRYGWIELASIYNHMFGVVVAVEVAVSLRHVV